MKRPWLGVAMLLSMGCTNEDPIDPGDTGGMGDPNDPTGGWAGSGLYACFAQNGVLGIGDSAAEAETLSAGTWAEDGTIEVDGEAGDWSMASGTLTLGLDCTDPDCGPFDYERDGTLDCQS